MLRCGVDKKRTDVCLSSTETVTHSRYIVSRISLLRQMTFMNDTIIRPSSLTAECRSHDEFWTTTPKHADIRLCREKRREERRCYFQYKKTDFRRFWGICTELYERTKINCSVRGRDGRSSDIATDVSQK